MQRTDHPSDWLEGLKALSWRAGVRQARLDRRAWLQHWPWHNGWIIATTAVVAGAVSLLPLSKLSLAMVVGIAASAPSGIWWVGTMVYASRHPYPRWLPYCRPDQDGSVGFYILRTDPHERGPALCRVTTPSGWESDWTLLPSDRNMPAPFAIHTGPNPYPTSGLGWVFPHDFENAPGLSDGTFEVEWRVAMPETGLIPVNVARKTVEIVNGFCASHDPSL